MEIKQGQCWPSGMRDATRLNIEAKFSKEIEEVEVKLREAAKGVTAEIVAAFPKGEIAWSLAWFYKQRGFTANVLSLDEYGDTADNNRLYISW